MKNATARGAAAGRIYKLKIRIAALAVNPFLCVKNSLGVTGLTSTKRVFKYKVNLY